MNICVRPTRARKVYRWRREKTANTVGDSGCCCGLAIAAFAYVLGQFNEGSNAVHRRGTARGRVRARRCNSGRGDLYNLYNLFARVIAAAARSVATAGKLQECRDEPRSRPR